MSCTLAHPCVVTTVQELVQCAVHHSSLAPKQIADALNVKHGYLLDAANPDRDDLAFQLRLLLPLIRATKRYDLLQALAGMADGVFVRVPDVETPQVDDRALHISRLTQSFGALLQELAAEASLDARSRVRVTQRGRDLITETARVLAAIEQSPTRLSTLERRTA